MTESIRIRADGSIDTAYYIHRGRMARSQAAHDMARTVRPDRRAPRGGRRRLVLPLTILLIAVLALPQLA